MAVHRGTEGYNRWVVRPLRCYEEGLALRGAKPAPPAHPLGEDRGRAILFEFLVAAVCHSTNWDRLRGHLSTVALTGDFTARTLSELTYGDFEQRIGPAFDRKGDLGDRHALFIKVAEALACATSSLRIESLMMDEQRLEGDDGLYSLVEALPAFGSDPQRKKARILVQQLWRHRLVGLLDPENVRPATEYHLIRLYLRTERVVHQEGLEFAADAPRSGDVRSVTALRLAVESAMYYTSAGADMSVCELNEIEWQIGRSFCVKSSPRCGGPPRQDKPVDQSILCISGGSCPFSASCNGPGVPRIARLAEPRLASHHAFY